MSSSCRGRLALQFGPAMPTRTVALQGIIGRFSGVGRAARSRVGLLDRRRRHTSLRCRWPGHGAHTMVLALASGTSGHYGQIHDFAVFGTPQHFTQPRLDGVVGT